MVRDLLASGGNNHYGDGDLALGNLLRFDSQWLMVRDLSKLKHYF